MRLWLLVVSPQLPVGRLSILPLGRCFDPHSVAILSVLLFAAAAMVEVEIERGIAILAMAAFESYLTIEPCAPLRLSCPLKMPTDPDQLLIFHITSQSCPLARLF